MITVMGRFRGVASLMFAGFLGVGGISAVVRTLATFETKMSAVNALLGDRGSTKIMRVLTDRARELGATTAFTASQAAEGMKFLTLAGFDALEVFQAIGPALTLAQAGALGLGQAADIVSNIMAAFAVDAGDVIEVVDALAFVSARSNTNINQLGQAMKFVAPVAGALGVSVTDTAVALGILGNAGLQASLAGTSLRRVMSGLLNPSKEATAVLGQMGLTSQELVELLDKEDGLVLIVEKLAAAGLDAADAFTLFGQRGAPGVLALVAQRVELRDLTKATREAEGAAQDMAETMIDNLGGDAKIAISALAEAILQIGDAGLTEFLRESTQNFTGFIRGLTGMTAGLAGMSEVMQEGVKTGEKVRENWESIKKAAIVLATVLGRNVLFGAFTKIGLAITALRAAGVAVLGTFALMRAGAFSLTIAIRGLSAALLASPLGIALLIGSLAAYILTGDDAAEISRKQAEALAKVVDAGEDAALTFDKVLEGQKKFKRAQVTDAIEAQRSILKKATTALEEFKDAQDAIPAAQARVEASSVALTKVNKNSRKALLEWSLESRAASNELRGLQATVDGTSLTELNSDVEEAFQKFTDLLKAGSAMDEVLAGNQDFIDAVAEAAAKAAKEVAEFAKNFKEITGVTIDWNTQLKKTVNGLLPMVAAQEKARKALIDIRIALGKTDEQLIKMGQSREDLTRAELEAEFQLKRSLRAETALEKARKTQREATEDLADKVFDLKNNTGGLAALNREYTRSVLEAALAVAAGSMTTEEYTERVRLLREELGLAQDELESTCEKTKRLKECQSEEAKAMEAIWDQAMRNIQDAFADAFKGAFDSFGEFRDQLIDAVKTMIAELLSAKLLGGLKNFFANIFAGGGGLGGGLGGLLGGGTAAAGATGAAAGGGGLLAGLAVAGKSLISVMGKFFEGVKGFFGAGSGPFGGAASGGGLAGSLGGGLAAAGVGFVSGSITDNILGNRGENNGTLSAIGGGIGAIFGGPLGAIIGGAIGSFASNLLGGAKALESATLEFDATAEGFNAVVQSITSKQRSFFRGRRFTTTRTDVDTATFDTALEAVVGQLVAVGEALGVNVEEALSGFNFSADVDIRGKSQEQIEALLETLFNDVVLGVITEFVDNAEGLSDRLRNTVQSFRGNAEEFLRAFELAAAIDLAFLVDPLTIVTDAIAEQNKTLTTSYTELLATYREVIAEYDGSLSSLEALSVATQFVAAAQLELTAALVEAGQAISELFASSAQTIRESLLSEEELFNLRKTQIDELVAQASLTTDPEELSALAAEINRLGLDAFNMLDAEQQTALGPEFIEFFDGLNELFGDQIDAGISTVVQDQADLDLEVANRMNEAAQAIIDAAATLQRESEQRFVDDEFRNELHR